MNKRGQGMSTTTIVLIVLAVLVLVFLVIGFTIGWKKIFPWLKPSNNVDDVKQACDIACNTNSKYNYCSQGRTLVTEDEELEDVTCHYLNKKQAQYDIETCSGIKCNVHLSDKTTEDEVKEECTVRINNPSPRPDNADKLIICDQPSYYLDNNVLESITCRDVLDPEGAPNPVCPVAA